MHAVKHYDVIIIGAGPAGIFTALELAGKGLRILIVEKGQDIRSRIETSRNTNALPKDKVRNVVCGWGGAGAFSDGKLTLTTEFGGNLTDYMSAGELREKIAYVDEVYCRFGGAERKVYGGGNEENIRQIQRKAAAADLRFIPARIRHLGTDVNGLILTNMRDFLEGKVDIMADTAVEQIVVEHGAVVGVIIAGQLYRCRYLVSAPGREGSEWFVKEAARMGLQLTSNAVDIGVRVEMPAEILETITQVVYESKLIYFSRSFDDRIRTFCMNPYGFVVTENNDGLLTVNGHSYANRRSENTNFAILVSKKFTDPFHEPIKYGKYIANLANILGGGVIVQRLGDLLDGRRSTEERIRRGLVRPTLQEATPGDLSLVLPYRHLQDIKEMLEALDAIAPGANSRHTLLYGVEVKFYSNRIELNDKLETKIPDFFAIGDGAGITRGLVQASAAGVTVGREILRRAAQEK
ncbi:NAD(P)/FAD-dependent oxidoreductase [Megasphaera vaginalis (ex Bordigoni et al. 2020)]|uniref:NAD(P)/FAD-dependent oxidoreductase n=1 Tax=Megasphaera vaginalis (ex Bordigoni et al. 2020) TaxID=2045301 RepID=UPI000C7C8678|nr:NAD(P)/FAD-dependent oxidoreductase [Megasphaera vaginalis (ex Bordigoni et al. 2020)]